MRITTTLIKIFDRAFPLFPSRHFIKSQTSPKKIKVTLPSIKKKDQNQNQAHDNLFWLKLRQAPHLQSSTSKINTTTPAFTFQKSRKEKTHQKLPITTPLYYSVTFFIKGYIYILLQRGYREWVRGVIYIFFIFVTEG